MPFDPGLLLGHILRDIYKDVDFSIILIPEAWKQRVCTFSRGWLNKFKCWVTVKGHGSLLGTDGSELKNMYKRQGAELCAVSSVICAAGFFHLLMCIE